MYHQNGPKFKAVHSQNKLPRTMKDMPYVVNLHEYKSTGTHWIALNVNSNNETYFDSFRDEHIPKK